MTRYKTVVYRVPSGNTIISTRNVINLLIRRKFSCHRFFHGISNDLLYFIANMISNFTLNFVSKYNFILVMKYYLTFISHNIKKNIQEIKFYTAIVGVVPFFYWYISIHKSI